MPNNITKLILCLLFVCVPMVWAQTTGGTLSGKITSPSGTGVANAAVTITNVSTDVSQRVLTGPDGTFTIAGLAPGAYKVEIESAGFKRTAQQNIELQATGPSTINITLEPGSTAETVEIKGRAPAVQSENGEVSTGVYTRMVGELPVVDRNHQQLMQLQTGVTPPVVNYPKSVDPERQREWATNGQTSSIQNLDGVTNLEPFNGTAIRVTPSESIQQLNITTSGHTADKGYAAGSDLNVVTRPGTNDWHGSLFEFHGNNKLRARSPWNVISSDAPHMTYNQFGATAGGHIVRDRFFFFGSYEGNYNRGQNTMFATVPTPEMRAGDFSGVPGVTLVNPFTGTSTGAGRTLFTNNTIPAALFNPISSNILPLISLPNQSGFANNLISNGRYENDWQKLDGRIDGHFTEKTHGFLRYGFGNSHGLEQSILGDIGASPRSRLLNHSVVFDIAHNFNPNLMGDFRFGYHRYDNKLNNGFNDMPVAGALGVNAFQFLPNIQVSDMGSFANVPNLPQHQVDNTFDWVTGWTLHTSKHNVKFGVDARRYRVDGFNDLRFGPSGAALFQPGPTLTPAAALSQGMLFPNSFASFLLGTPTATGAALFTETPTARQTQFAGWIGDTINLYQIVTLDIGLRYEVYSPWAPRRARGAMFYNPANNTLNFAQNTGIFDTPQEWDTNNFAPRIGFAIRATPKTVIRGGYTMNYFQQPLRWAGYMPTMWGSFQGVPGGFSSVPNGFTLNAINTLQNITVPTLANGITAFNGPLNVTPGRYRTPYVQHLNLQVQQELVEGMVFGLGYVGALGRKLPYRYEANMGLPGTGLAGLPFASFGRTASTMVFTDGVNSNYNSLQVNLTKRMGHGLSFQGAYTWSKSLGYTDQTGLLLNPFDRRANYGPADFDRQHTLTIAHVWDLPVGTGTNHMNHGMIGQILGNWAINGVFTWASGQPFTVFADPLFFGGPNGTVIANVSGPVTFADNNLGFGTPFFNTSAFTVPAPGTFGNLGRNSLRGPGFKNYNFSLFKTFAFMDRYKFELRGEAYNLTNSPHWGTPVTSLNAANFGTLAQPLGGDTNAYGSMGRQVNLAVRLIF
jgi:hypothetical protein